MARKYDIEDLFADLDAFLKANVNTQIQAIDTEKGALATGALKTIDSAAFFAQSLNLATAAYDPFLAYGLIDQAEDSIGPATADILPIQVVIVVADAGQDPLILKRMFRYQRALKEIFTANWDKVRPSIKIEIAPVLPVQMTDIDTSKKFRAVGVQIKTELPN